MIDIRREGLSQRSAPLNRHMAHLRHAHCTPRKPSGWNGVGDKPQPSTGGDYTRPAPGHLSCSDLERAQNAGSTKSAPLWSTKNLNLSGLDLGRACKPGPASDSSQHSNLEPEQCRLGKLTRCEWGNPLWLNHCEPMPLILFTVFLPPQNTTEGESLKKSDHHPPLVSGRKLDTEETEAKIEGTTLEVTGATD